MERGGGRAPWWPAGRTLPEKSAAAAGAQNVLGDGVHEDEAAQGLKPPEVHGGVQEGDAAGHTELPRSTGAQKMALAMTALRAPWS